MILSRLASRYMGLVLIFVRVCPDCVLESGLLAFFNLLATNN